MSRIAIIGAGISGPAAALSLATYGHSVTVFEQREESELRSFGVIGITHENWMMLVQNGANPVEYDHEYTDYNAGTTTEWDGHYVEWSNLHLALVDAARDAGARFYFGTRFDSKHMTGYDYYVFASGVGQAAHRTNLEYTGYVVYRGLSYRPTNYSWLSIADPAQRWNFKLAYTDHGAAWELYSHLPKPRPMGTTTIDAINPSAYDGLPAEFVPFITESRVMYRAAISDWDVPETLMEGAHIYIGDANGAMRPHTGMGANLGIAEAFNVPYLVFQHATFGRQHSAIERVLLADRTAQHDRGIEMGQKVLGS
jgi:hypothetical protein